MELEKQKRVIDMMITAHSVLAERFSRKALLFDTTLLIASIILNAFVFVDYNLIERFTSIGEEQQKLIIGISTILVFIISIILIKVDWKEKSAKHREASNHLFHLLQECRSILLVPNDEEKKILVVEFDKKYTQIMSMLVPIPNNKFNSLKLIHYRKVELSKLIDKYPGGRLFTLKIKLFLSSIKKSK